MADHAITIDLSAPARIGDLPRLAGAFFRWWGAELLEIMPRQVKALIPKAQQPAVLFARRGTWRLVTGGDDAHAIELDAGGSDSHIAEQILQRAPDFAMSRLAVVLPRDGVVTRRIELPMMPEASVRDAVALQADRLSPFKADNVRVAARVVARHVIEGKLEADVAFAPGARIAELEARLAALGLKVVAVDVEGANGGAAGFDLRASSDPAGARQSLLVHAGLAASAALMWALASYALVAARESEIESWKSSVAAWKPVAERAAGLRRQIAGMSEPFEIARTHEPARLLTILTELTDRLPDDARLTEFRFAGDAVELTGIASNAPTLISKLEASKRLTHVKFRAPVTRWQGTVQDRFEISAKLETGRRP